MKHHPPLRIGVTGHRWTAEPPRLRLRIRAMLRCLMNLPAAEAGMLVVSPLAEGADRLVAEEALSLGAAIECPLPLNREDYERDFVSSGSLAEFRDLLARASSVDELGGDGSTVVGRKAAYAAAGSHVVDRSDLLLAIWDGQPSRGEGGTAQVVAEALEGGRPVLWVRLSPHHGHEILTRPGPRTRSRTLVEDLERSLG